MLKVDKAQRQNLARQYGTYQDVACERVILSAAVQFGAAIMPVISEHVHTDVFTLESNREVWDVLCTLFDRVEVFELGAFFSTAKELGLARAYEEKPNLEFLRALHWTPVKRENIEYHARRLRTLHDRAYLRAVLVQALLDDDLESAREVFANDKAVALCPPLKTLLARDNKQ
jgi:replicative DNA helicase